MTLAPLIAATYFIVAGGPFGLEDIVAKSGYSSALLILLLTPLLWALPTALMVSELASAVPQEGGYYVWVTRAMGPFWGFQEAWLSLAGSIFDMAIYPTLFVEYLGHFAPAATAGARGLSIGVSLVAVCAAWNLLGARAVGISSEYMGILLMSPFLLLSAYALFHHAAGAAHPAPWKSDLLGGVLVAMWNYMGWDNASTIAGEVERPQLTYPLAMFGAVLLVSFTYAIPVGAVALTGLDAASWTSGGWADVGRAVMGSAGAGNAVAFAITVAAMLGAAGTMNTLTMAYSRLPAAMAGDGFLPEPLARQNARTGAPTVAILACAAVWALCLGLSFVKLVVLDVLLTGLSILLEFAALVALRLREPDLPRPYRVPGGLAGAAALGLPPLALLAITALRSQVERVGPVNGLQLGALCIAAGVASYFWSRRGRARRIT